MAVNMADENVKFFSISIKIGTPGFLRSLIINFISKLSNLKWRIQNGGPKYEFLPNLHENRYLAVFNIVF